MTDDWKPSESQLRAYAWYQKFWCQALRELLEWDEEAIAAWLESCKRFYSQGSMLVWCLHETPAYEIAPLLVPASLLQRILAKDSFVGLSLDARIAKAIEDGRGLEWYNEESNPDWAACRQRVDAVLAEFEEQFPEPESRAEG